MTASPATPKVKVFQTFDRNIFRKNWKKINESPLKRGGLLVRRIAINSIGRTVGPKTAPRPAGMPPRSRSRGREIKRIFSVVNSTATVATIGPVGFSRPSVPELHEKGKSATRTVRQMSQRDAAGRLRRNRKGRFLKSRFGKPFRKSIHYKKRPTMEPALNKVTPMLPRMWRGSVSP